MGMPGLKRDRLLKNGIQSIRYEACRNLDRQRDDPDFKYFHRES